MPSGRKTVFIENGIYHIYNRGIDKRVIFPSRSYYIRAIETIRYYQYSNLPLKFSDFLKQPPERKSEIVDKLRSGEKNVEILAFCLMPNHYHFLLKQKATNGIRTFISNFSNSIAKYFNTRQKRTGHLFQGEFKSVFIEDDSQLIHLSRYIHLNPVVGSIITIENIDNFIFSSYPSYVHDIADGISNPNLIIDMLNGKKNYKKFVFDHVEYAKSLHKIKHLVFE